MGQSWEQMVDDVCVNGRPEWLRSASQIWSTVFTNAGTVSQALRDAATSTESYWKGPAGDDYRTHLNNVAKTIDSIHENNSNVTMLLTQAAADLDTAQQTMPIPDHMLDKVNNRRKDLDAANATYGTIGLVGGTILEAPLALPLWGGIGAGSLFGGGEFWNSMFSGVANFTRDTVGWLKDKFDDHTAQAQEIYDNVNGQYEATNAQTGNPSAGHFGDTTRPTTDLGGGGATGGLGGAGHMPGGGGAGGLHPPGGGVGKMPGTGGLGTGTGSGSGLDGGLPPTSGLDGVGGGPLSGLGGGTGLGGLGSGGLGSGAGGLGPLGGAGAGAGGLAGAGVGKPVSLAGGLAGMPMGGAAGRGAGAGGRGSGRGAGMMGGHDGRHGGEEDDRTTWLTEDDDVWGADSDASPGVIDGGTGW